MRAQCAHNEQYLKMSKGVELENYMFQMCIEMKNGIIFFVPTHCAHVHVSQPIAFKCENRNETIHELDGAQKNL